MPGKDIKAQSLVYHSLPVYDLCSFGFPTLLFILETNGTVIEESSVCISNCLAFEIMYQVGL